MNGPVLVVELEWITSMSAHRNCSGFIGAFVKLDDKSAEIGVDEDEYVRLRQLLADDVIEEVFHGPRELRTVSHLLVL